MLYLAHQVRSKKLPTINGKLDYISEYNRETILQFQNHVVFPGSLSSLMLMKHNMPDLEDRMVNTNPIVYPDGATVIPIILTKSIMQSAFRLFAAIPTTKTFLAPMPIAWENSPDFIEALVKFNWSKINHE